VTVTTVTVSVGGHLRELRTRRGLSLDELSRTTRVASRYLQALENDAFGELPAPVFIRGFIRAYCQAVGESPEEALAYYDGRDGRAFQPPTRPLPPARTSGGDARARGTIVVSFVLLLVLGMALFTVALVIRPGDRPERSTIEVRPDVAPTSPRSGPAPSPPAGTPGPGPAATSTAPPAGASPSPPVVPAPPAAPAAPAPARSVPPAAQSSPPGASPVAATSASAAVRAPAAAPTVPGPSLEGLAASVSAPYRLIARTSDVTWIRVRTEDGRSSEETVPAGEIREWVSDRPFVVTVGNAGGVSLELNGRALPPLGPRGAVLPRLVVPPESR
jgi:cytoskeleton protein RodZ